jgi:hypothetical protein
MEFSGYKQFCPLFLLSVFLVILPVTTRAEASKVKECTCFCALPTGAQLAIDQKNLKKNKILPDKCETICKKQVAVCATSIEQFPGNNRLCFTEEMCKKQDGDWDGKDPKKQPYECLPGMFYCFPNVEHAKAKLNVKIGNLDEVGELGIYVAAIYKWMIGAAGLFAIVMMIIGGLQWVLSAGGAGSIESAKSRMRNGIIGLILLFAVVLIMQNVNPQLLKMEVPRLSKIRPSDLLSGKSCEDFEATNEITDQDGGLVPDDEKRCGTQGIVGKSKDPQHATAGTASCQYTTCTKGLCVKNAKSSWTCAECRYVSRGNPLSSVKPNNELCQSMTQIKFETGPDWFKPWYVTDTDEVLTGATYCEFQPGGILDLYSQKQTTTDDFLKEDSCFEVALDCSNIEECDDYDDVPVYFWNSGIQEKNLSILPITARQICIADPCLAGVRTESECDFSSVLNCW